MEALPTRSYSKKERNKKGMIKIRGISIKKNGGGSTRHVTK